VCWKNCWPRASLICIFLCLAGKIIAQQQITPDTLQHILDRLDTLEKQNEALINEVRELRQAVKSAQADTAAETERLQEQANVQSEEIKTEAQSKIAASQRFSMSLTGMFLFDTFLFKQSNSSTYIPDSYNPYAFDNSPAGATLRQSIVGFEFGGPQLPGGGQVHGSLSMDFWAQAGSSDIFRIRRGTLSFDWKHRSVIVGQDKSVISPLQPTSFAWVSIPPLSGAGNLWLWRPQVRYEERVPISGNTRVLLQAGVLETDETYSAPYLASRTEIYSGRPAVQARIGFEHRWSDETRVAFGIGGHASDSHILGESVPSRLISVDALYKPLEKLELSGTIFHGENFANLGGLPPGVTVRAGTVIPIRGGGGWIQLALPLTKRLTFDVYGGRQLNDHHDLNSYEVYRTLTYASNVLYRISPNVILGFEGSRNDIENFNMHRLLTNRYDATIAYLF
jgi:hypothetical protein